MGLFGLGALWGEISLRARETRWDETVLRAKNITTKSIRMSNSSPLHTKIKIEKYEDILKQFAHEGNFSHPSQRTNILSQSLPGAILAVQVGGNRPTIYTGIKSTTAFINAIAKSEGREIKYKTLGRVTNDLILEIYH